MQAELGQVSRILLHFVTFYNIDNVPFDIEPEISYDILRLSIGNLCTYNLL